jgi:metacaspase-1
MPRGISIHIGLNQVDPNAYEGWDGALAGCENDARDMKTIADGCGYEPTCLLSADATSEAVCGAIGTTVQTLQAGDHLLLTYSGHGGQIPDSNGDEDDAQDETWVLYDRMFSDDELYAMWSQFAPGVRIFVLSDSCHSGTVVRMVLQKMKTGSKDLTVLQSPKQILYRQIGEATKGFRGPTPGLPQVTSRYKAVPGHVQARVWDKYKSSYRTAQWIAGRPRDRDVSASVILISGCQDNQLSMDGTANGLFTEKLKAAWNDGAFEGGHKAFHCAIAQLMPATQAPNYYVTGAADQHFEDMHPFDLGTDADLVSEPSATDTSETTDSSSSSTPTPTTAVGDPTVHGPATAAQDQAPTFTVERNGNPYYIFELADSEALLESPPDSNDVHYYGTWADTDMPARLTADSFTIPDGAWTALAAEHDTVYFRVGTTSSQSAWDDYHTSPIESLTITVASRKRATPPPRGTRTRVGRGGSSSRDYI